jgi:hypothetical protein
MNCSFSCLHSIVQPEPKLVSWGKVSPVASLLLWTIVHRGWDGRCVFRHTHRIPHNTNCIATHNYFSPVDSLCILEPTCDGRFQIVRSCPYSDATEHASDGASQCVRKHKEKRRWHDVVCRASVVDNSRLPERNDIATAVSDKTPYLHADSLRTSTYDVAIPFVRIHCRSSRL